MSDTYKKLQALILVSEGKTLEDELGFGCKILMTDYKEKDERTFLFFLNNDYFQFSYNDGYSLNSPHNKAHRSQIKEILGQDIGVNRVLMALEKKEPYSWAMGTSGELWHDLEGGVIALEWNLNSPLHLQTEEVQKELLKILNSKTRSVKEAVKHVTKNFGDVIKKLSKED